MENLKALTITLFSVIIFCHAVSQITSKITVIFKQTWGYEPTFYNKIQSLFVVVAMLGLALVTLVFYMCELDTGQVQKIFRNQLVYSLLVATGVLISMLTIEVFRLTIFAQFCCHVLLASLTLDEQNHRSRCIYMDPFDCLFPTGTTTITNVTAFQANNIRVTVNSTVCPMGVNPADKLVTHVTVIEFWLIVANLGCCLLLISLIRTLVSLSTLFEQYSLQPSFFNKLIPTGLKQRLLIITCLSYFIATIAFCITFYQGSASFYEVIIQWNSFSTGWMKIAQILYCSFAIFSALMVLMFFIPQTLKDNSMFSYLLMVSTYAFLFGWLAIVVTISIPTYITMMYTCYCEYIIANKANIPITTCMRFQSIAMSLFSYRLLKFENCGPYAIKICGYFLEAKTMLIIAFLISTLFVPSLILFLISVRKSANPDIISETSRNSSAHSLSTSNSSDSE